mgnify:FL=1
MRGLAKTLRAVEPSSASCRQVIETKSHIISEALRAGRTLLTEPEAKSLCREYSIPVPRFEVVKSLDEVFNVSKKIGFPLAAKIVSPQVVHKTDAGGVVLGIQSPDEGKAAFTKILRDVGEHYPKCKIDGVLLEPMTSPGIEVIVGVTHDPQFGKVLMFGLGGVFVEVFRDVTFRLLPINEAEARSMIHGIRSYRVLAGHRGTAPVDESAITRILLDVSRLVSENDEVMELDLNPIMANDNGATAVDARVILSETRQTQALPRYPASSLLNFFKAKSVAVVGASATVSYTHLTLPTKRIV